MKKKQITGTHTALRFRRWSRAGYAVFCSLGCSVSIGRLAIAISDKSLQKLGEVASYLKCTANSETDTDNEWDEADMIANTLLQTIENNLLIQLTTNKIAAYGSQWNIYLLTKAVEMRNTHFNRFLFKLLCKKN